MTMHKDEFRSAHLINELQKIYLSGDWRKDPVVAARVEAIKKELGAILGEKAI